MIVFIENTWAQVKCLVLWSSNLISTVVNDENMNNIIFSKFSSTDAYTNIEWRVVLAQFTSAPP